jgi:hypothetical protein
MKAKKDALLDLREISFLVREKGVTDTNYSGWGVVMDVSWPYKTEHADDYYVKIKIIDSTLHPMSSEGPKESISYNSLNFIHLFIFSRDRSALPICAKLGLIAKFKRFRVPHALSSRELRCSVVWKRMGN